MSSTPSEGPPGSSTSVNIVNERHHRPLCTLTDREREQLVYETIGPNGPLVKRKAFTRADVIRVVAPALYGCAADELDRVLAGIVQHRECVALVGQPGARGRAWAAASVLATEQAIEAVAERLVGRESTVAVGRLATGLAIANKQRALGRSLTDSQRHAIAHVFASGRSLDLIVGVAGSGKTTALDVLRAGYEGNCCRVLGTAISGQAARTLHEAGVDARTMASLVWRLAHQQLDLDERTVLLIDEAGMADDQAMLKLLAAVDVAGAKPVVVGDHHQLDAVEAAADSKRSSIGTAPPSTSSTRTSANANPPSAPHSNNCAAARSSTPSTGIATTTGFARPRRVRRRSTPPSRPGSRPTCGPRDRPARMASARRRRAQRARSPAPSRRRGDHRTRDRSARRQGLRRRGPHRHPRAVRRWQVRDKRTRHCDRNRR